MFARHRPRIHSTEHRSRPAKTFDSKHSGDSAFLVSLVGEAVEDALPARRLLRTPPDGQ
ncbi:hypothetical protein UO65_3336 [Actinokineospora spheciospongiae]|uniref:Uncharacterized protein n=1 Tax=Actinokineospora spheciospongiae TaxID=909613 RepID=W7ILV9_9PSEU|nr:hypothetical protein UO65_3336 [Actinokineospora spheciospongiae]